MDNLWYLIHGTVQCQMLLENFFVFKILELHLVQGWRGGLVGVVRWLSGRASDLRYRSRGFEARLLRSNLRQVVHTLLPLSPSSIIWYQRKLGSKQAYRIVHQPVSRGLAVFADAWLSGWLAEISADLRETVAH